MFEGRKLKQIKAGLLELHELHVEKTGLQDVLNQHHAKVEFELRKQIAGIEKDLRFLTGEYNAQTHALEVILIDQEEKINVLLQKCGLAEKPIAPKTNKRTAVKTKPSTKKK